MRKRKKEVVELPRNQGPHRRKLPPKHEHASEVEDIDAELGLNLALGKLDSQSLADLMAQNTKRFGDDLSLVELDEKRIPGTEKST